MEMPRINYMATDLSYDVTGTLDTYGTITRHPKISFERELTQFPKLF